MLKRINQVKYKGTITLKSSNKSAFELISNDILSFSNTFSTSNFQIKPVTQNKVNKYITIFKSPFVYKKAKDTFLFESYSSTISFETSSLFVLKLLISKLENFKGHVDSNLKISSTFFSKNEENVIFGTERFRKFIIQK